MKTGPNTGQKTAMVGRPNLILLAYVMSKTVKKKNYN